MKRRICEDHHKASTHRGEIVPANPQDFAAAQTIKMLRLDHRTLSDLRKAAMLNAIKNIKLNQAKRLLASHRSEAARLNQGQDCRLDPFCFAIEQVLEREIKKIEGIRANAKRKPK